MQHSLESAPEPTPRESDTGFLLINLGTPNSTAVADVRTYLNEFLMDRHVLSVPWLLRRLIVSAFILPRRPRASAEAYASIWTADGSPLMVETQALADAIAPLLTGASAFAMRYGEPSISDAITTLEKQDVKHIVAAPLYPQYADATTTTAIEAVSSALPAHMSFEVLDPFYVDAGFIDALKQVTAEHLPSHFDHLLMSFHGLPERALKRCDPTGSHCLTSEHCCDTPSPAHATCYRHQAYGTAHALAQALQLGEDQYSVSFQSRLGRLPWITPYTDQRLAELPTEGIKHLAVVCPAFVADNIETLEEIGIQGREIFTAAGGETLTLIPCLNDNPVWVTQLATLLNAQIASAKADTSR